MGEGGRGKFYWLPRIFAVEIEGMAQEGAITLVGSKLFIKFIRLLSAHSKGSSCQKTDNSIPRCIYKIRSRKVVFGGVLATKCLHHFYLFLTALFDIMGRSVEQQTDIRFSADHFQKQGIEDQGISFRISVEIFEKDFVDHPTFSGPTVIVSHMGGSS